METVDVKVNDFQPLNVSNKLNGTTQENFPASIGFSEAFERTQGRDSVAFNDNNYVINGLIPFIFYECFKFVDCIELAGQSVKLHCQQFFH